LLVDTSHIASVNVFIRISWICANEMAEPVVNAAAALEGVEIAGSLVSGYQRSSLVPREWGPIPSGTKVALWLPVGAPYFQISVYTDTSPGGSDYLLTNVVLASLQSDNQG
jgi:hypothetical protein